jgi:peroxiredoxin/uncharacterized membrane protein YphA (DoxX/SURF4 family)
MAVALLLGRILLAVVFLVAGVAKLADISGSRRAAMDFGVPSRAAGVVGVALPLCELAVAAALLFAGSARWAAVAATVLLLAFAAAIVRAIARGERPDCHCFGQLHSTPAGYSALGRNLLLAGTAGFVAVAGWHEPGASATGWIARLDTTQAVGLGAGALMGVAIVFLGWFCLQLLRQQGRLLHRLDSVEQTVGGHSDAQQRAPGLEVGSHAPGFELAQLDGEALTLEALLGREKPVLLVFSDPGCVPCDALLPELAAWQRDHAERLTIALLSRGGVEENATKRVEHGLDLVLLQRDREVASAYQAHGTPAAVLVSPDGRIARPLARGPDEVRAMVARATGLPTVLQVPGGNGNGSGAMPDRGVLQQGEEAPDFALPDVHADTVELDDLRGRTALLLFWDPGCGFCQRMLEDLRAFDAEPPRRAPSLVVISTGTLEDNRAMGLNAKVLSDPGRQVMASYRTQATPTGVVVDSAGLIASELAAGAAAVFALAGAEHMSAA